MVSLTLLIIQFAKPLTDAIQANAEALAAGPAA